MIRAYEDGGFGSHFDQTVAAAKAGGDWAWRELYRGTAPTLARYLRARGVPDAEDIVGETFLRVVTHLDGFVGDEAAFRTWLFTIERNTFYTAHQQRRRHPAAPLDEDRVLSVSPTQEWSVRMSAVQAAVLQLPAEQREALLLVAGAGMTYDEAAVVCECALGTIKSRINRARHRLEELLEIDGAAFCESSSPSS